jgi:hypothetical protein
VRRAAALLGTRRGESLAVNSYTEDSAGVLVSLVPILPPHLGGGGGGGLVRVGTDGSARIVQLYR